eukprot:TRINITY_DN424_c0_g1_i1.p1 TRINITY_DN424_c0_g1~~TRINITY_DN424_c0_g1_i1.p1  ORF type:complete len:115 (+),score=18.85 TRINITY_DN424_c0_g1_i1:102-446(+)
MCIRDRTDTLVSGTILSQQGDCRPCHYIFVQTVPLHLLCIASALQSPPLALQPVNDSRPFVLCLVGVVRHIWLEVGVAEHVKCCLLYTSDAADEEDSVDLGGRRIIKKKKKKEE